MQPSPPGLSPSPSLVRRAAIALFLAVLGFLVLLSPDHIDSSDGVAMYSVARAMVDHQELSFPPLLDSAASSGPPAPDAPDGTPRRYSKYGLGASLVMAGPYALSRALLPLASPDERGVFHPPATAEGLFTWGSIERARWDDPRSFRRLWYPTDHTHFEVAFGAWMANLSAALVVAALAAALFALSVSVSGSLDAGIAVALMLTLATPFWLYGLRYWSEPVVALLFVLALLHVHRWRADGDDRRLWLIGLAAGAMLLVKTALAVLWLPLGLAVLVARPERRWPILAARVLRVGLGAAPPVALALAYNLARFGTLVETGYGDEVNSWTTPFWTGLAGLLVSPGRGLLIYFPLWLPCLLLLPRLARRAPELATAAAVALPTLLLLYSRWWLWEGGWCWGPRFLLPALPPLLLSLATAEPSRERPLLRVALTAGLLGGVMVAYSGVSVGYHDYYQWMRAMAVGQPDLLTEAGVNHYYELMRWDWRFAPVLAFWTFPMRETLLLPNALLHPGLVLGLLGLGALSLLVGAVGLLRIRRRWVERGAPQP